MKTKILTSSEIRAWKECPLKWYFRYHEWLVPKVTAKPLTYGRGMHGLLEAHYSKSKAPDIGEVITSSWEDQEAGFIIASLSALFDAYVEREPLKRYEIISVEDEFKIPLRTPSGRHYSPYQLAGKCDLKVKDSAGNVWLVDHKTSASRLNAEMLMISDQMRYYVWAAHEQGINPAGIIYNLIRKPSIKPRIKDEPKDYERRLREDIEKRPLFYFQQEPIVCTQDDLDRIQSELWDLAHMVGRGPIVRNPGACRIFGCPYRNLCEYDTKTMRANYDIERPHSELTEVCGNDD